MKCLRLACALALAAALACGKSSSSSTGGSPGMAEGTFAVTVQNGQDGNGALRIRGGRVFTADLQIDCGVDAGGAPRGACSAQFPLGATVVLDAEAAGSDARFTPPRPNLFLGWSGDCTGDGACRLSGNADRYVVASFGGERTSHANFSSPAVHGPAWAADAAGAPGALDCESCHGASLQGQGIAVSCSACHAWPRPVGPPLTFDAGTWDQTIWE